MAKPRREGNRKEDSLHHPASPGEPNERVGLGRKGWQEQFPGWETYEGRAHDPRFGTRKDPHEDPRWYTKLNPSSAVPKHPGVLVWALLFFFGIVLLVLFGLLMYYHFQRASPRSPTTSGAVIEQHSAATTILSCRYIRG